jgi:hypothetical protein
MAASTRIKAQNILFKIGSTDYACDANMVSLTLEDAPGDVRTFCETRVGGQWTLELEGITSGESTSLYRVLWDNFGDDAVFIIAPYGNDVPTADEPHYTGEVVFSDIPPLALTSNETSVFTVTLEVKTAPHDPSANQYYGVEIVTAVEED